MPRIRSLKPEFWADQDLADLLSRDARLLYMGLWNLADEHGRLRGDARYVKGQLFPYDDDLDPPAIDALLDEIEKAGKATRYEDGGRAYMWLPTLGRHQRLEPGKVPSKLPAPPSADESEPDADAGADSSAPSGADESAPRANESALLYGSGIRDQGMGVGADGSAPGPEPPPRCAQHLKSRNPPNCGLCKDARREHGRWLAERTARLAAAPKCPLHPTEPAHNCGCCRSEELSPA